MSAEVPHDAARRFALWIDREIRRFNADLAQAVPTSQANDPRLHASQRPWEQGVDRMDIAAATFQSQTRTSTVRRANPAESPSDRVAALLSSLDPTIRAQLEAVLQGLAQPLTVELIEETVEALRAARGGGQQ